MRTLKGKALLNDALGSAIRSGGGALGQVPGLLKHVLEEESWREFVTQLGEHVSHEMWADFVTDPPLRGLGATEKLIDRLAAGSDDPDLLRLLRSARRGGAGGRPPKTSVNFTRVSGERHGTGYDADRLAREAAEEYEKVRRGEKTVHAAALDAGTRKRQVPVRLDSAESAARTLRKHMQPEILTELIRLLSVPYNSA